MNRRNALRLLGSLIVFLGGTPVIAKEEQDNLTLQGAISNSAIILGPIDFEIDSENVRNLVIRRKEGKLVIPFAEIIDALKEE